MEFLTTMFKPRPSQSPAKQSIKRPPEDSPVQSSKVQKTNDIKHVEEQTKFTFDEVKTMLEKLIHENERNKRLLVNHGVKDFDFSKIATPGRNVELCRDLVDRLVKSTRRIRTLHEVLNDIKDNLDRKTYTEVIQRATLGHERVPKRPPSAYLLYHRDRYEELKHEMPVAAEVSKMVSKEWKSLSERKRREYQKRHNDLMRAYENEMKRLGLVNDAEPKRPGTARTIYIQDRFESVDTESLTKQQLKNLTKQFGNDFDVMDRDEKKVWIQIAKERLEQYRSEHREFTASHPHLKPKSIDIVNPGKREGKNGTRRSKIDLPHPPKTPLVIYMEKKMPDNVEGEEAEELKRKLKDKFSQMSAKKQLKFIKKAVKDKDRYQQDINELIELHPEMQQELEKKEIKANLTKEQWKIYYSMVENRPSLPAPNTYLYYCGKKLCEENYSTEVEPTQRMQQASQAWKALSVEERSRIEKEHIESVSNYIEEMTNWLENIDPERKKQILLEEPRLNPDYWRRKLSKSMKAAAKLVKMQEQELSD